MLHYPSPRTASCLWGQWGCYEVAAWSNSWSRASAAEPGCRDDLCAAERQYRADDAARDKQARQGCPATIVAAHPEPARLLPLSFSFPLVLLSCCLELSTAYPYRRAELEQAARAAVNADNDWWRLDAAACAPNLRHAASPRDLKRDILAAADAGHLVLVDYFKPGCHACRSLAPKLKQLAEQNPDVLILKVSRCRGSCFQGGVAGMSKCPCRRCHADVAPPPSCPLPFTPRACQVNTEELGMRELAGAMGVEVLPWFQVRRRGRWLALPTADASATCLGLLPGCGASS